jgi:hypothetical protein
MCAFSYVEDFHPLDDISNFNEILEKLDLGYESTWMPHYIVNTLWLENSVLAFWLVKTLRPDVIVELGTDLGFSYMVFCQAVKHLGLRTKCYAVDLWLKDKFFNYNCEDGFTFVTKYSMEHYNDFSVIIRSSFDDASHKFGNNEIDLLHIDGTHTYDAVKNDFEKWIDKMSDKGVILFHDINVIWEEYDFGVWSFWNEIREKYPSFSFYVGPGLGVLGVGKDLPEPIKYLLSADKVISSNIQSIFGKAGINVRHRYNSTIELPQVYSSRSWKITAPLRTIFSRFRRIFGRSSNSR